MHTDPNSTDREPQVVESPDTSDFAPDRDPAAQGIVAETPEAHRPGSLLPDPRHEARQAALALVEDATNHYESAEAYLSLSESQTSESAQDASLTRAQIHATLAVAERSE